MLTMADVTNERTTVEAADANKLVAIDAAVGANIGERKFCPPLIACPIWDVAAYAT